MKRFESRKERNYRFSKRPFVFVDCCSKGTSLRIWSLRKLEKLSEMPHAKVCITRN